MDAYLPPSYFVGPAPAILLIHGGGWQASDTASTREVNIATDLAKAGYAVFSIKYLLNAGTRGTDGILELSQVAWPQNFYDCKSAVRFIRKNARKFDINSSRIGIMGGSAGGHLAMLVGSTTHHEAFNKEGCYTEQSNKISCVLNFYGEFDVRERNIASFAGKTQEATSANEAEASPITWIDANTPPMFIAHGTADTTIPVERSRALAAHLQGLGLQYTYMEIANAPHTFDLHPEQLDLESTVLAFLKKYLGKPSSEV